MKIPVRRRVTPQLNLSPLIDVIFILLIFVVLVARFVDQERMDVTVPSAEAGRPAEVDALMITVTAGGQVAVEEELVTPEQLQGALLKARQRYSRAVVVADATVALQAAVDVISSAKLAGFEAVAVATHKPDL